MPLPWWAAATGEWRACSVRLFGQWSLVICHWVLFASISFGEVDSARVVHDTTIVNSPLVRDSLHPVRTSSLSTSDTSLLRPAKKPWLAVGLSAALPGLGQMYDEAYWKVPVIVGLGSYWVYEWIKQNDKYRDYRDRYNQSLVTLPSSGDKSLLTARDFYLDQRDKFAWFLGALYFLNLVDAYVGANLYDFDVGPDLTADGKIVPKVTASIRLRF